MRFQLLLAAAWTLTAQTPDASLVFDVASVKHGPPGDFSVGGTECPSPDPTRCVDVAEPSAGSFPSRGAF